ncbi:MAG: precorrin-2 C(20)-methyltransferase [Rhodobacteraceae bacterium]|nr:precorrin-2 C(20)-methyltransferase [Paracoccaceae bacterium]
MELGKALNTPPKPGALIGVGIGPGAPDLLTIRAARLIEGATTIAYPAPLGGQSLARSIAASFIPKSAQEIIIAVPMTQERGPAQDAYDRGAALIAEVLEGGEDVICLCEGDPLFFGSFMYLHARLAGKYDVSVVPGITSVSAATALAGLPLAARNDQLSVLSAGLEEAALTQRIAATDAAVIMKLGRHLPKLRRVIEALGLTARAHYVERVSLEGERLLPLADAPDTAPYFSMILLTKGGDPWL